MDLEGFLLINKPVGLTSFDVIRKIKRLLPKGAKLGHAGTLDPFASGLLIIALSRKATREMRSLMTLNKVYYATGLLGQLTDTLDSTGSVIEVDDTCVTDKDLEHAVLSFGSSYIQIPPIYSALKLGGKPLYKHARENMGTDIDFEAILETKKREVQLYELIITACELPRFSIKAHVSHGTYIRSLVNDIAKKCGTVATTVELCRTSIGPFALSDAQELAQLKELLDITEALFPVEQFLAKLVNYQLELREIK